MALLPPEYDGWPPERRAQFWNEAEERERLEKGVVGPAQPAPCCDVGGVQADATLSPAETFLCAIFKDAPILYPEALIEIAYGSPRGALNKAKLFGLDELAEAANFAGKANRAGENIYVGPALRRPGARRDARTSKSAVLATLWLVVEFDEQATEGLERLRSKGIEPRFVVTSGTTPELRLHTWIRLIAPIEDVFLIERALRVLIGISGSDPAAKDAGRVMRCAGTFSYPSPRKKERGYVTEQTSAEEFPEAPAYAIEDIIALEPAQDPPHERASSATPPHQIERGDYSEFFRAVKDLALDRLDVWVPVIFPSAKFQPGTGGWRVSSRDLGRNLEEDLSFAPGRNGGIKDFGVADMGDARQGARTAIDIVMEWGGAPTAWEAAKWLCERMGVAPEALGARVEMNGADIIGPNLGRRERQEESTPFTKAGTGQIAEDPLAGVAFDGDAPIEPPRALVKRLIPFEGIAFIGGQSGAGKTFVAVDLAVSLASGVPFFGQKVAERVGVVILAAEGASTIGLRIHVAREQRASGELLPIAWIGSVPNLSDPRELPAILAQIRAIGERFRTLYSVRLGAVIIDTLAAALALKDENDNAEAARAIRNMKALADWTGAVVIPVHHYGKAVDTGLRGASAWRAGCDAVLSIIADRNEVTARVSRRYLALAKSRVGEEGPISDFELRFIECGQDEDGEAFGACVVEATGTGERQQAAPKLSRTARAYLQALQIALINNGEKIRPFGSEGPEVTAADRERIRNEFYRAWPADGETEAKKAATRRQAFSRGEGELLERKAVATRELEGAKQMVWAIREATTE